MTDQAETTPFYEPTLHKPVPMGAKVLIPSYYTNGDPRRSGVVVGISMMHVIFSYIVLLDEGIETPYGLVKAVCVSGSELDSVDGSNWRLDRFNDLKSHAKVPDFRPQSLEWQRQQDSRLRAGLAKDD